MRMRRWWDHYETKVRVGCFSEIPHLKIDTNYVTLEVLSLTTATCRAYCGLLLQRGICGALET